MEANFYARQTGLAPSDWLYVRNAESIRGRLFRPDSVLVYLPGFDERPDVMELIQQITVARVLSVHSPTISDMRSVVPDELLRNRGALMAWLEA